MKEFQSERVLVTGANGFVGSHLVEALLQRGYQVRCMVRRSSDLTFIRHLPVEWAYGDVCDAGSLGAACRDVSCICHCAALTRALSEKTFMMCNVQGTTALASAALEHSPGLRRFLFVSSQAAAGPSGGADDYLDESHPPRPVDWYGKSKWAAEQALLAYGDRLPLTIVRPAAVFGPRDRDFWTYFRLVKRGLSLQLGRTKRLLSFMYVHDLISLILLALESETALGQAYFGFTCYGSYADFSSAIARALGKRAIHIRLPEAVVVPLGLWARIQGRLTGRPALLNEQRLLGMKQLYWLCSGDKARRELGFHAAYDLDTAVQQTADWYTANGWL